MRARRSPAKKRPINVVSAPLGLQQAGLGLAQAIDRWIADVTSEVVALNLRAEVEAVAHVEAEARRRLNNLLRLAETTQPLKDAAE